MKPAGRRSADPPRAATWLLEHLGGCYCREPLSGDLIEEFRAGRSAAWYWRQVLQAIAADIGSARRCRGCRTSRCRESSPRRANRLVRYWLDYRLVLLFLMLMGGYRSAWADWVRVPTGSMNPTILEGDRLLVDKHVYGLRVPFSLIHLTPGENPARGDIVIFDSPRDGTLLVKRVIGIPGDTVALVGEKLIVNGVAARYATGDAAAVRSLLAAARAEDPLILRESGAEPAHDILLLPARGPEPLDGPITVPKGMYFVLGDNRDDSADSRYIGFVPRRNILGRATRVVVSLNPDRYDLPRRGRFWRSLYARLP